MSYTHGDLEVLRFSESGDYALVIHHDFAEVKHVYVHPVTWDGNDAIVRPSGRWECSVPHMEHFTELYTRRFPVAAGPDHVAIGFKK